MHNNVCVYTTQMETEGIYTKLADILIQKTGFIQGFSHCGPFALLHSLSWLNCVVK
jgi:hypothetical protein